MPWFIWPSVLVNLSVKPLLQLIENGLMLIGFSSVSVERYEVNPSSGTDANRSATYWITVKYKVEIEKCW